MYRTKSNPDIEAEGYDLFLLLGANFYYGFNAYAGVGWFNETWDVKTSIYGPPSKQTFNDIEYRVGTGYTWKNYIGVDLAANFRPHQKVRSVHEEAPWVSYLGHAPKCCLLMAIFGST